MTRAWHSLGGERNLPLVSVLVTTYNHERYIRAALESVYAQQTSFPVEVVVCDDGSTDRTRAIVEELAALHPDRTRLSCRESNAGDKGLANFLAGLEMCRGEYIATMDGDDYWTDTEKLQRQADFLDARPTYSMCFHNCRVVYEDLSIEPWETKRFLPRDFLTTSDLLAHAMGQTSTMMIREAVAQRLRESVGYLSDWLLSDWFTAIVASQVGFVGYIDPVMSVFRQHKNSGFTSLSRATQWAEFIYGYEAVARMLGPGYQGAIERSICVRSYTAAREYEKLGELTRAREFLLRVLKGQPGWLEPYFAGHGASGDELFRIITRRARLYQFPPIAAAWLRVEGWWCRLGWHCFAVLLKLRAHLHLRRGGAIGFITASPNPALASARADGRASVMLTWSAAAAQKVEVHVGKPDGPLFSELGCWGAKPSGEWVEDGTTFYLQDTSDSPLTSRNTLDAVRVRVKS